MLQKFIQKYSNKPQDTFYNNRVFEQDFNDLQYNIAQDPNIIMLAVEQFIENRLPSDSIKKLISLNQDNKLIINNENLFKWACAFHSKELILYFHELLTHIDYDSAITASIINCRFDNLLTLKNIGAQIFDEKYFTIAIQRFEQKPIGFLQFIDFYISNKDKFYITDYSKNTMNNNKNLLSSAIWGYIDKTISLKTIEYLINENYPIINFKKTLIMLSNTDDLNLIKLFFESEKVKSLLTQEHINEFLLSLTALNKNVFSLDIFKYILFDEKLSHHPDIHYSKDKAFSNACINGNVKLVDFLLNSSPLNSNLNTTSKTFSNAFIKHIEYMNDDISFVKYCIFDLNIKQTKPIKFYLQENPNEIISTMFLSRDLNSKLKEKTEKNSSLIKKLKI